MTDLLREELQRLGDQARPVAVPAETWRRGRRARLRDRVFTAGAAVAVLAVVAGTAWAVIDGGRHNRPTDDSPSPGVPDRILSMPYHALETTDADLRVGLSAAAYTTEQGDVVTVSAIDGSYRHLLLERLQPGAHEQSALWGRSDYMWAALSPDGRLLAYSWEAPTDAGSSPAGISIIDLVAGQEQVVVDLTGGGGIRAWRLTWSADSQWLAWSGSVTAPEDDRFRAAFGRVHVRDGSTTLAIVRSGRFGSVAIGDDGVVRLLGVTRPWRIPGWAAVVTGPADAQDSSNAAAVSADGHTVFANDEDPVEPAHLLRDSGSASALVPPTDPAGDSNCVRVLGWTGDGHVVAEVISLAGGAGSCSGSWVSRHLVVAAGTGVPNAEVVATVQSRFTDAPAIMNLTVATALMSADHPTVSRPEPRWPWSAERKALVWGLVIGLPLAALLAWRRFRRRPLPTRRTAGTS